jgi:hypothetical protein
MKRDTKDKIILYLSLPLAGLIIINSYCGLFIPGTYARETFNWYAQAIGQDIFNLFFIAPLLLIISVFAYKQNKTAILIWGGIQIFILYTYAIYCFAVHFNGLFLVYCAILGLSFYSFVYFIFSQTKEYNEIHYRNNFPVKSMGIFLIVLSCLFYLIWLKEIIPAIMGNTIPMSLADTGILTNPVHVLDLSLVLPGLIITAVLLLKKKSIGLSLAPAMLVFCILMAISIGVLIIVLKLKGLAGDWSLAMVFGVISVISLWILVLFFSKNEELASSAKKNK